MDESREKELLQEFARAFNWYDNKKEYGYSFANKGNPITPSWEAIFVQIGKLLANQVQITGREEEN